MELVILDENEYDAYGKNHACANFLNSIYSGRKFLNKGWTSEYLGLKENGELKAATLLVSTTLRGSKYFYAPRGYLIDFHNKELVVKFSELLLGHMKKNNGLYFKLDPYVAYQQRDLNGNVVEGGFKNDDIINNLKAAGFSHQGFRRGYDGTTQCRWMSVLDLKGKSKEQVLKEMNSQTRQNVKNTIKNGIKVRALAYDELSILIDVVNATGERRGFDKFSLENCQLEYETFKEHACAYYAYLDLEDYKQRIDEERSKEEETLKQAEANLKENPHSKNSKSRMASAKQILESLDKREKDMNELVEECGKEVPLAAALFIMYGNEIIYLTSGSYDQYKRFKGPYALQWQMIQKGIEEGYDAYNFYGISGLFEKEDDGYGVFDFKRGFKADVVELVGDFILPVNEGKYKMYKMMQSLKNKVKK